MLWYVFEENAQVFKGELEDLKEVLERNGLNTSRAKMEFFLNLGLRMKPEAMEGGHEERSFL